MSRELDSAYAAGLAEGTIAPVVLAQIGFASQTVYAWTGIGDLSWNGATWKGLGSLGAISPVQEGMDVQARGVTLRLSGIDPVLFAESMTDIRQGAPARLYRGLWNLSSGGLLGTPYQWFRGQVDKATVAVSAEAMSIDLEIESRILNLQRASGRRYTAADQRLRYPTDMAFNWQEQLNDLAILWGN